MTPSIRHNSNGAQASREAIASFYDQTWIDFRLLWLNQATLACHFGYYDATTRGHADSLLRLNQVLAERAAIKQGQRVLDAGCGVGGSSLWLAEQLGAEVVGISLSSDQVARARHFASERGLAGQVSFERADYTNTTFPDGSFDVIWAIESVCYAYEKAAFYREAARLLKPGGRLIMADFIRSARPLDAPREQLLRSWLDGWAMPDLDTDAEQLAAATAAGFSAIEITDITSNVVPSLRRLARLARLSYPLAILTRALGLRSAVQHGNVRAALRQLALQQRGCWYYGIIGATMAG